MPLPIDYHMHSSHSWDCKAKMADMCQAALDKSVAEIAFTEHFDHFDEERQRPPYHPDEYFAEIEQIRVQFAPQGLTVRAGIELGEYHQFAHEMRETVDGHPYDIVLGSLHYVGGATGESIFQPRYYTGKTLREAVLPYFTEMLVMIEHGGFDILSHMDVFKRRAHLVYGEFHIEDFEPEVRAVWQLCIQKGIGIEINTGGLRWKINEAHPNLTALKWYREMGGEILTVGSDAHHPKDLAYGLEYTLEMAREAGFKALAQFEQRRVKSFLSI